MKSHPKGPQVLAPDDFPLIHTPQTTPNQTLPQFKLKHPSLQSPRQNLPQIPLDTPSSKGLTFKFNLCSDNLKCFMPEPKTQKFRSLSLKLNKQSRSAATLQSFRLDLKQSMSNLSEQFKSQTERHHVEQNQFSEIHDDSDISTIFSNEIIQRIERKGIRYNWSDVEASKLEANANEDKEDEEEIEELFNMFSEVKYAKRSAKQNFSTNQSFMTEASLIEGEQSGVSNEENFNNFSGYQNVAFNQCYQMQDQSFDKNYSLASTIEPYTSMYYPMHMYQMTESHSYGLKSMPSILFPLGEFIIRPEGLGKDPRTTLMIKNIPNKYTIQYLSEEIDREFSNYYDFLYLPCDTKSGANQGYGFINFTDLEAIRRFYEMFHGKRWGRFRSEKICNLTYARLQGIASLIEHFQNSKVLNHKEKKYQPIIKKHLNQQINNLIKEQQIAHESTQLSRQ